MKKRFRQWVAALFYPFRYHTQAFERNMLKIMDPQIFPLPAINPVRLSDNPIEHYSRI